jgi:hypothetical protein
MQPVTKFQAAPVPRFIRQAKLSYLPMNVVIGSYLIKGDGGSNIVMDVIMLPAQQFQRMRTNVGLQHVATPTLQAGPGLMPSFMLKDVKEITVPEGEPDAEGYAKAYFVREFKLENFS